MIRISLLCVFLLAISCKEKPVIVTKDNLTTALPQYGQQHKENEVQIETSFGTIKLRLYEDTPLHRANFIYQINENYYERGTFYRIVNKFMIQGGVSDQELDYLIPAEFSPKHFHKKGALAMARYDEGNPEKASSATEFYIIQGSVYNEEDLAFEEQTKGYKLTPEQKEAYMTVGGDMSLDGAYTVFGEVVEGFDVIDKIAAQKVHSVDKPLQAIPFKIKMLGSNN